MRRCILQRQQCLLPQTYCLLYSTCQYVSATASTQCEYASAGAACVSEDCCPGYTCNSSNSQCVSGWNTRSFQRGLLSVKIFWTHQGAELYWSKHSSLTQTFHPQHIDHSAPSPPKFLWWLPPYICLCMRVLSGVLSGVLGGLESLFLYEWCTLQYRKFKFMKLAPVKATPLPANALREPLRQNKHHI